MIGGVVLLVNAELLPSLASGLPGNLGDPMLNAWILGWVSEAALSRPTEIWNAPIFHPHENALALSEHLLGVAAMVAPVYWATRDAVLTYNVAFLVSHALLGLGMFVLVRRLTGREDAALVAAAVTMCSPYFTSSQLARVQTLSAGWSLFALAALHRAFTSGRGYGTFGACWIAQFYSNTYLGAFLAVPVGIVCLDAALARRLTPRAMQGLALAGLMLGVTAWPVLEKYRSTHDALGLQHPDSELRQYSARPRSYSSVWLERQPRWLAAESSSDRALYPGTPLAFLAVAAPLALWLRRARIPEGAARHSLVYGVIAVVAAGVTLGPEAVAQTGLPAGSPYDWLAMVVPGFGEFRAPGRFAVFVVLSLGVVGGLGLAATLAVLPLRVRLTIVAAVIGVAIWEGRRDYAWVAPVPGGGESSAAYEWLALQPRAVVLELPVVSHFQLQRPVAGASVTLRYQLAALRHGHVLLNGASGFVTPFMQLLQGPTSPFTILDTVPDALRVVRAFETRFVVVHRHEYLPEWHGHLDAVMARMREDTEQVEEVRSFGSTAIVILRPAPPAERPAESDTVEPTALSVQVSHSPDVASHLIDGIANTRWIAPQHGAAWLEVHFDRPRVVWGAKLGMAPFGVEDFPYYLRIVGTDASNIEHVLYARTTFYETGLTALFEPYAPGLRLTWPARELWHLRFEVPMPILGRRWAVYQLDVLGDRTRSPGPGTGSRQGRARESCTPPCS